MRIIEDIKAEERENRDQAFRDYSALVKKAAGTADGSLPPADAKRLRKLVVDLGFSTERLEADAATFRRLVTLEPVATAWEQREAARRAAEKAIADYNAETDRLIEQRRSNAGPLIAALNQAEADTITAAGARDDLRDLRATHWRLLGLEDPAVAAKRRHLVHQVRDAKPLAGEVDVINVAAVFENPAAFRATFAPERFEFIPAPGQSEKDLAELVNLCRNWTNGAIPQPVYLRGSDETWPEPACPSRLVREFDAMLAQLRRSVTADEGRPAEPPFDPSRFTFVLAPGQNPARLTEMVATLRETYDKHPIIKGRRREEARQQKQAASEPAWVDA